MKYNKGIRAVVFLVLALLLINIIAPAVSAKGPKAPRGGRLVSTEELMIIDPDDSVEWTELCNLANESEQDLLDYNLSWRPFFENNTDLQGVLVHTLFSPMLHSLNVSNQSISVASMFKLAPGDIMDGISEVWFRLPITDVPVNATIRNRVYRILTTTAFDMTLSDFGMIDTDSFNLMQLIYDLTVDPSAENYTTILFDVPINAWQDYFRWQNVTVPRSNNTFYYNWTFMKACFPMFPNEWYLLVFDILAPYADNMKLAVSTSDFGSDGKNNFWAWMNGVSYNYDLDLDTSFLARYGVSNGISGIGTNIITRAHDHSNTFSINSSIPINQVVSSPAFRYFNVIVPVFLNSTYFPTAFTFMVLFYSSADDSSLFHRELITSHETNATYDFVLASIDMFPHNNTNIDHIRLHLNLPSGDLAPNSTYIKLWGTQKAVNNTIAGFTDIYWFGVEDGIYHYIMLERQWFVPVGYFGLDTWYWNMTNYSFITIPIKMPLWEGGVTEAIQDFEVYIKKQNEIGIWEQLAPHIWNTLFRVVDWVHDTFGKFMVDVVKWVLKWTPLDELAGLLHGAFEFFKGIGIWIWEKLVLIFDALEWFTYWAVRVIYSLSIAIVYIVNIFGVISINSALLNVSRTGNGRDFVRAFQTGWRFIFAIISLLLSLAIMAITIVSAVVPF